MSHFSVLVRVPSNVTRDALEDAVAKLLLPYKESGCGDADPPELRKYEEFEDCTDAVKEDWESETVERVRMKDGSLLTTWDERFRIAGIGIGGGTHKVPDDLPIVNIPVSAIYSNIDEFAGDYHGYEKHGDRWGYWHNPNAKWDWWTIGGRWSKELRDRSGNFDVSRIADIDTDWAGAEARRRAEKFWGEWRRFCDGEKFDGFDGPRGTALAIGLLECKDANELTGDEWKTIKWERQLKEGVDRFDVLKNVTWAELWEQWHGYFDPVRAYARCDGSGWSEPGRMGWFGHSGATADSRAEHIRGFAEWLKSGDQRDWVVMVDCHI